MTLCLFSQLAFAQDSSFQLNKSDSLTLQLLDSLYSEKDTTVIIDTLYYSEFVPYDKVIWRNSKINLRKTLSASKNPPIRKNLNNYGVFIWALFIVLLIIFFKSNFALQYRLLNKSWYSNISFNEFFSTQTSVFKNSKLLTWLIISQAVSLGVFIIIRSAYDVKSINIIVIRDVIELKNINNLTLALLISAACMLIFIANHWLKNVFAYSFYQPSLNKDYAIIYRINAYVSSLFLIPLLMLIYYYGLPNIKTAATVVMVVFILFIYMGSLVKFFFSGRFLQNQSNFILILYLCAFEILPLLVLIKSINKLLEYD